MPTLLLQVVLKRHPLQGVLLHHPQLRELDLKEEDLRLLHLQVVGVPQELLLLAEVPALDHEVHQNQCPQEPH